RPVSVADGAEQYQGVLHQRDRLGPVAVASSRAGGEAERKGLAGQVTGLPEMVQGLAHMGAVLVMSAGKRAEPADHAVGPAQRNVVDGGLGGGQHRLAGRLEVGPVSRVTQEPALAAQE